MESYIVINGKKAELTKEQLKALGIETEVNKEVKKEDKFKRKLGVRYYFICHNGEINNTVEQYVEFDDKMYNFANYCTDKKLIEQRALHEILNRKLWRFSCENGELENEWNCKNYHHCVVYDAQLKQFGSERNCIYHNQGTIYFSSRQIAQKAIDEIIKPFMKEHPDFVW